MTESGWRRSLGDPIPVPAGGVLKTLADAGHYVTPLPKAMQERPEWQTAAELLMRAAEGRRHHHVRRDRDAPRAAR